MVLNVTTAGTEVPGELQVVNSTSGTTVEATTIHDHFQNHLLHPGYTVLIASVIIIASLVVYMQMRGAMWIRMSRAKVCSPQEISEAVLQQIEHEIRAIESSRDKVKSGSLTPSAEIHARISGASKESVLVFSSKDCFVTECENVSESERCLRKTTLLPLQEEVK